MTSWGSSRTYGPMDKGPKQVGNDFLTVNEDSVSGSPLAVGTTQITLNIPDGCVEVVFCSDAVFYFTEDSNFGTYFRVPTNTIKQVGVAERTALYLKSASGTANVSIEWVTI